MDRDVELSSARASSSRYRRVGEVFGGPVHPCLVASCDAQPQFSS